MKKLNKNIIGWVVVLNISFGNLVYGSWGVLGDLFTDIDPTAGFDYRLMGDSIEDNTIDGSEMEDAYENTLQKNINNSPCAYGIKSISDTGTKECASNNNTNTQLSEAIVDSYVSNNGYLTSYSETDPQVGSNSLYYIPRWNGSSLVKGSIYDNGSLIDMGWKRITSVASPSYDWDVATKGYVDNNGGVPSGAVMAFALGSCPTGWSAYSQANGRTIIGVGSPGGTYSTYHGYGSTGGKEKHRLTTAQMPSHTHTYKTGNSASVGPGYDGKTDKMFNRTVNSGAAGSNQAHNNMQPYITLRYCRKN